LAIPSGFDALTSLAPPVANVQAARGGKLVFRIGWRRTRIFAMNQPLRIVVVDDDRDTTDMLVWLLQMAGHEVTGLYGGSDVLAKAFVSPADVMLLDLAMPDVDGYELARQIRQREDGKGLLLIAVTGLAEEADRQRALEAGFDHYLVKPVEFSILAKLLDDYAKKPGP
jgi:DNA-binding response OmpR family regulator